MEYAYGTTSEWSLCGYERPDILPLFPCPCGTALWDSWEAKANVIRGC